MYVILILFFYITEVTDNKDFNSNLVRFTYSSFITPNSVFDYDVTSKQLTLKKEQPVLGGYDKSLYTTERVYATARDGTKVAISMVYKTSEFVKDGSTKCLLYGYGSYSVTYDPFFNSNFISYLDRGVTIAIAHIRGGGENGRLWYEQGKFLNKKNTYVNIYFFT